MKIQLVDIDKAFKYYQINDINYKNRCYKCIEDSNISSLSVLIQNYMKNRKEGNKRELIL